MGDAPTPTGWTNASLRDLVERSFSGPSPMCDERQISADEEWGLLKTTAITWEGWNESAHKVPPRQYWGKKSIEVHRDDVLITKAGPRHRVGVVVHVAQTGPRLMVSGKMIGLRPKRRLVLPEILAGLLSTEAVQDYLNSRTTGMAESQTNFADHALLSKSISVPPMSEQLRVADVLRTLSAQIYAVQGAIAKLKAVRSGMLNASIARAAQSQSHGERSLSSVISHLIDFRGRTPKKLGLEWGDGEILALSANNVQMGGIDATREAYYGSDRLYRAWMTHGSTRRGDVLMTLEAPLGNIVLVPDDARYILSQRVVLLRFDEQQVLNDYAYWALRSAAFQRELVQKSTGTTASGIRRAELERLSFPIPALGEQRAIADQIFSAQASIDTEYANLSKLRAIKAGLASDLLTGRVRVSEGVMS